MMLGQGPAANDVYIVQGLMETDLHKVLKKTRLSSEHICFFTYAQPHSRAYVHTVSTASPCLPCQPCAHVPSSCNRPTGCAGTSSCAP